MKTLIYFNNLGIHEERLTNKSLFDISDYPGFNSFNKYPGYLVLFDKESTECNCVKLPFTTDIFNGSILVIKLNKNDKIITFQISKYLALLDTRGIKTEYYSSDSSDEDPFSNLSSSKNTNC